MSTYVSFFKISTPAHIPDGTIDLDKPCDLDYYSEDGAPEWAKKTGVLKDAVYEAIDLFDVGEQLYGKRPISVAYNPYGYMPGRHDCKFTFPDGTYKTKPDSEMSEFFYQKKFKAYFLEREEISSIRSISTLSSPYEYDGKVLTKEDFERMADECFDDWKDVEMCKETLYAVMKAYREFKKGGIIVAIVD